MEKKDWIIELTEELKHEAEVSQDEPERWKKISIYKIPIHAANLNKEAYNPWVVAVGPYHHDDERLKRMEEHKKRAFRHFLHRKGKPLESYVDALAEVVRDLMDAYAHLDVCWEQDAKRFLQLMIVDGCFVLEIMRAATQTTADYSPNDLVFSNHGTHNVIPCLRRDMLLIENQVPLLALERLLAVETGSSIEQSKRQVIKLILKFFELKVMESQIEIDKCQHLLDVYRKSLILEVPRDKPTKTYTKKQHVNKGLDHSATELKEAGIKFEKGSDERLKDISFTRRTLKLPAISLDDTTESTYLNMVAFERLHVEAGNEISSYIFFMNRLVTDAKDVRLLKEHGIISSAMGCDEDVAKLFLKLSKEILIDYDTWLDEVYVNIDKKLGNHFENGLYSCRYHLIHTYFRSPWALISVVAAAIELGLSTVQVIYAVLAFIHGKDQGRP